MTVKRQFKKRLLVIRLPIRNWNKEFTKYGDLIPPVIRLPIRNWNCTTNRLIITTKMVIRLPIRNWNRDYRIEIFTKDGELLDYL
mgnify:CR=1 FL=1